MSKKELNTDFDVTVRVQKAFTETTAEKVEKHQGLNDEEINLADIAVEIKKKKEK